MARWSSRSLLVFVALSALAFTWASAAPAYQQIVDLPGISKHDYSFNQYAGYVNITSTKHMFYWFVESQRNPSKDPVMVWMNGGPGASSLMGFFTEHGPFRPEPNGKDLKVNPYAWNRIANIIYLEAPVGVGFSYSDDKRDYVTDDIKTVKDNYQFLLNWFELFPEFKSNPFFVTGESYGGHYVPELASLILEGLRNGTNNINMQGVIVGNPGTNNDWYGSKDEFAYITFLYNHALIPQDSYIAAVNACNWTNFLPTCSNGAFKHPSTECKNATATALSFLPQILDPYDVYSSQCLVPTPTLEQRQFVKRHTPWHPILNYRSDVGFYPCLANYMTVYLNEPSVQTALHVKPTTWKQFGDILYTNETLDMVPLWYEFATKTTWKNLVFTGDVDSAVPFLDTQKWINCMNLPLVNPWRPWMHNGQTAGIRQDWKGLSFQTLKGCGHMVPYYCPELGFVFFENWLNEIL